MKAKLILAFVLISISLNARPPDEEALMQRGILLYRLEKASWYGTDNFLANFPELRDSIGGYLSYVNPGNQVVNIFFNQADPARILVRFTFESMPNRYPVSVDTDNTAPTDQEQELITLRRDAVSHIRRDTEGFFALYENTTFNPIPLITPKERLVYFLTAPLIDGVVIIGNDYLLTYDQNNRLKKKEKIHNSLLQFPYAADEGKEALTSTYHSHVISEAIDVTDICTLLLYRDYVEWKTHYVLSKKYVSILDLEKEQLVIMKMKHWKRILEHQEESEKAK